jgi:uncharacterized protein YcbK (DUF882 family)
MFQSFVSVLAVVVSSASFSGLGLSPEMQERLIEAHRLYGSAFTITSGHRTPEKNAEVGGVANSFHLTGNAVDILRPRNAFHAQRLLWALALAGFTNVGVYRHHFHVDMSTKRSIWEG